VVSLALTIGNADMHYENIKRHRMNSPLQAALTILPGLGRYEPTFPSLQIPSRSDCPRPHLKHRRRKINAKITEPLFMFDMLRPGTMADFQGVRFSDTKNGVRAQFPH